MSYSLFFFLFLCFPCFVNHQKGRRVRARSDVRQLPEAARQSGAQNRREKRRLRPQVGDVARLARMNLFILLLLLCMFFSYLHLSTPACSFSAQLPLFLSFQTCLWC